MIEFIKKYPALLAFGILTAAFSSPGQTFLVSLFIPHMQDAFAMSKTQIAGYYSMATLVSAMVLPVTGRLLDRTPLLPFTLVAGVLLAVGLFILNQAREVIGIFIGFFLIRNMGQGTVTMVSLTTMAKIFGHMRGKALGVANLGYPLGEAIFPIIIATWIMAFGWRSGWLLLAATVLVIFLPLVYFLLRNDPHKKAQDDIAQAVEEQLREQKLTTEIRDWTLSETLRDWRFYVLILPVFIPAFFFTGLFFHQLSLMEWKGWSVQLISAAFIAFGIGRATVSFLVGPVIDKWSARKVFPFNQVPLLLGLLCFLIGKESYWAFLYLGLSGMTMGFSMTVSGALYAEFYGVKELGTIRGIKSAGMVFCTAVAPILMGALLDSGIRPEIILINMMGLIIVGMIFAWLVCAAKIEKT